MKIRTYADWQKVKRDGMQRFLPGNIKVSVGLGSCGIAAGSQNVYSIFQEEAARTPLDFSLTKTGCLGFCGEEPLVNVLKPSSPLLVYHKVTEKDAREIIRRLAANEIYDRKVFCKIEKVENYFEPRGITFGAGLPDVHLVQQENKIVMPSAFSPLQ